jgi:hypothetical protein
MPVPEKYAALLAAVREQGSISVIVGLDVPFQPEGEMADPQAVQTQRQAIAAAQERLLQRMAGLNIRNVTTYEFIPFVAMTIDEAALRDLIANPEVTSIEQNTPNRLQGAPGTFPSEPDQ